MAILESFPNKPGHTITDNSSPITERDSVNLIDFDVTDDSTNEQTDVTPHRLTSAELDEIVAGVPNGYNDMPVVLDERNTEYVVGCYINSDGTKQPLYERTIINSFPQVTSDYTDVTKDIPIGVSIKKVGKIHGYINWNGSAFPLPKIIPKDNNNFYLGQIAAVRTNEATTGTPNVVTLSSNRIAWSNVPVVVTIQYTKTTDTPI